MDLWQESFGLVLGSASQQILSAIYRPLLPPSDAAIVARIALIRAHMGESRHADERILERAIIAVTRLQAVARGRADRRSAAQLKRNSDARRLMILMGVPALSPPGRSSPAELPTTPLASTRVAAPTPDARPPVQPATYVLPPLPPGPPPLPLPQPAQLEQPPLPLSAPPHYSMPAVPPPVPPPMPPPVPAASQSMHSAALLSAVHIGDWYLRATSGAAARVGPLLLDSGVPQALLQPSPKVPPLGVKHLVVLFLTLSSLFQLRAHLCGLTPGNCVQLCQVPSVAIGGFFSCGKCPPRLPGPHQLVSPRVQY